ncbi:glycosyltransferase family 2 protein [Wocania ichthyoenteri]|uniref:glycosyltransferase family 2 protein n=1 Tax=Wocania ichthyoenteri TaxID=1230531 RepID=UPI00053DAD47|nr:glycosyltransferase family A protein [Wocania ichthyoenteri]
MAPFFSVIIPLYNKEKYIEDTLRSVLNQTFQDFEVIIVDDGSTDNSVEEVNKVEDSRISIFTIENQGVSHARNFGISKASTNYIAFLDADDLWLSNHLELQKYMIENFPNCGLYASAYEKRNYNIKIESYYLNIPKNWVGIVENYFESSFVSCIAWTSAVIVPKNVLQNFGGFDEKITLGAGEDTDLWIQIALQYKVAFNNQVTAIYNLHADNRVSKSNTNLRQFLDLDKYEEAAKNNPSLKKYLDLNRFSIVLQYKLVNNKKQQAHFLKNLDKQNLNKKQRFLLQTNSFFLKLMFRLKYFLRSFHVNLSSYK